ncbi:MAG: DUF3710 domain-containing protein [Actinomycetaceae bacterium]|nr:DUF3710 domain-containing protein [Actinomycetaceae bacterium]
MALFGRNRNHRESAVDTSPEPEVQIPEHGPYDSLEKETEKGYIDFGPIRVPQVTGMQLVPTVAPGTKTIVSLGLIIGTSRLELRVFASPKSGGSWKRVQEQLETSLTKQKNTVTYRQGRWGKQMLVSGPSTGGSQVRIIGLDGRRWFLRVDVMGAAAADSDAFEQAREIIDALVVHRDDQPRPPLSTIPMTLPAGMIQVETPPNV